jgi:hypothetical protein
MKGKNENETEWRKVIKKNKLETCLMKIQEIIISFYDSIKTITLIAN